VTEITIRVTYSLKKSVIDRIKAQLKEGRRVWAQMQAVAAMFKMLELRRSLMAIESMRNAIEEAKTSADSQNWKLDQSKMKLLPGIEQRNKHLTLEFMNSEMEKYGICTEA